MTKHRSREERIDEILGAAAEIVESNGLAGLTMEAIASRTSLSKGGVYRFFANRSEVALGLFGRIYARAMDFDFDEALSWGLPLADTLARVLVDHTWKVAQREGRIWIQLLPETLRDERFRDERLRLSERAKKRFGDLVRAVARRDGLEPDAVFDSALDAGLALGVTLMEGLAIQGPGGLAPEDGVRQIRAFVFAMVASAHGAEP